MNLNEDDVHLVLAWGYKKELSYDNDDVEILGIYRDVSNAIKYINHRFSGYLRERKAELVENLFPIILRRDLLAMSIRQNFDRLVSRKIMSYIYQDHYHSINLNNVSRKREWKGEKIKIKLNLNKLFEQLMDIQNLIARGNIIFPDYCEIPIIINNDVHGLIRRMSTETFRIKIKDHAKQPIKQTMYIGYNLIDIEDCDHREHHFCGSYRIYTKTLRD